MTTSQELPENWRYNVKELRMEHRVPCYDENEDFLGHVWCALVPDDILEDFKQELQRFADEVEKEVIDALTYEKQLEALTALKTHYGLMEGEKV